MESFKNVIFGVLLFFGSFVLLYWNEGRVDMSKVALTAVQVNAEAVDATANGKMVSVTGKASTDDTIGDGLYLKPGNWMAMDRIVEMYAWDEEKKTKSQSNTGGSSTETTTYTYGKKWMENPQDSSEFAHPEGHENPRKALDGEFVRATSATIGAYDLAVGEIELPPAKKLKLDKGQLELGDGVVAEGSEYLFKGKGSLGAPELGDLRISYKTIPGSFDGTAFGKLEEGTIRPYMTDEGDILHRLFYGSRDGAIVTMANEYQFWVWIFRLIGFFMMFMGISLVLGPISMFMDVIPIFGTVGRAASGGLAFIIALPLSIITILVSMVLHSFVAVLVVVALAIALVAAWFIMKRKKATGTVA
jgi:hypothetical protein